MASLGELFIELGVLGDDEGAKKVAKSIDDVIDKAAKAAKKINEQEKSTNKLNKTSNSAAVKLANFSKGMAAVITAISGAVIALNRLSDSLVQQNQYWINLTRNSDVALSTYQKWGAVGAALDKSLGMEGAAGALKQLNDQIFEYKLTGQNAEGFLFAGITPTNAEDVMEQLRNRISGMNDTSASYLLRKLGIDERMLPLLRMTKKEFEDLSAEMQKYQLTLDQRKTIQQFHKEMSIVNVKMQYFKDRILLKILPHFLNFMRNVEFLTEGLFNLAKSINKVTGNWKPLILIAVAFLAKIKPIAKIITVVNTAFGGLITKIPIIGKFLGGLGGIIGKAFLPLTALYLLIDDVRAFMQGGRSGIGYLLLGFQRIKDIINFDSPDWLKNLVIAATNMPNMVAGFQTLKDIQEGKEVKNQDIAALPIRLINPLAIMPHMLDMASRNSVTNNNTSNQVNQNISITTNQPAQAIQNNMEFARKALEG